MKKIIISTHASLNMINRGASEVEIISAIELGEWREAKRGKLFTRKTFIFDSLSPVKRHALCVENG